MSPLIEPIISSSSMSPAFHSAASGLTLVPPSPAPTDTPSLSPAQQPKERQLTVIPRTLPKGRGYVNTPQIILCGLYLEKVGFTIGSKVTVLEKPGEIIVRLDGASAEHDPNETPDDRRLARKVKQVTDYQQSTELPLSDNVIALYLSGKMPIHTERLLSRLIAGEVPESYQARASQILNGKKKPAMEEMECDSLLWEIDHLPKPKRKRAVRQRKPLGTPIQPIPTTT